MKPGLGPAERLEWALYAKDAHAFVFGLEEPVLWTKDEHDQECPEKPFPDYFYLRVILDCLLVSGRFLRPLEASHALSWGIPLAHLERQASMGMVFMEKSRQILASWVCGASGRWRAMFHRHQLCIVQSKKEDDAAKFVFIKEAQQGRISFMESRLPLWLQDGLFVTHEEIPHHKREFVRRADNGHLWYPNGSHIWAVPQGGDVIRSNTPSVLLSDEAAFQPAFALAYQAALPSLKGGGQGIFISSAEVGDFATLVEAEV